MIKHTFTTKIADIPWEITHQYPYVCDTMKDYIVAKAEKKPIAIASTKERIEQIQEEHPKFELGYCEADCVYQEIAEQLPLYDRLLMHGAVITYKEDAFMFTAPSGTGKSTHISLWNQYIGSDVDIVNGDKPIVAIEEEVIVYGTPWGGKENWQKNRKAPLKAIVLIEQSKTNSMERVDPGLYVPMMMQQIYLPKEEKKVARALELLDGLLQRVPFYVLRCDMSEEAVRCSFDGLTGKKYDDMKR